ncbi:MAG: hypothetical protein Q7R41_17905, partial [Phycisphaerales bacterium]|nr:hypothetical protein [Phycisphaerales bacterium]
RDVLWNRLTFPIWGRYDDEIVGFNGRAFPDARPKYLAVPAGASTLINERGLRSPAGRLAGGKRFVDLCEGDTDTATFAQMRLPVVGVRGVNGLRDEFLPKFDGIDSIYVWPDHDAPKTSPNGTVASGAGEMLAHRAGQLFGNRVRVCYVPEGEDVNSWFGQKKNLPDAIRDKAPAYVDWLISRLPADIAAQDVAIHVKAFIPVLLTLAKTAQDAYVRRLSRVLKVSLEPIREELREATAAINGTAPEGKSSSSLLWGDKPRIHTNQALIDGTMHTVVFLDVKVTDEETTKVATLPHIVTSKRELYPLNEHELFSRGIRYVPSKVPAAGLMQSRWSTGPASPHGVKQFIDGAVVVSPTDVYSEVVGYLRRHMDYPNPYFYDFLALWSIGT